VVTIDPPTPPPPGWPHTISSGTPTSCARAPLPNEVIVATEQAFGGRCASLKPGFYPHHVSAGVGTDGYSGVDSIKVGSGVRARAFQGALYSKTWTVYPPNTVAAGIGTFRNNINSWRIEPANRSMTCDDLREGEIALFELEGLHGDCVVLPGNESYANPEVMGIEGNSISSIHNQSSRKLLGFWHSGFNELGITVDPHTKNLALPTGGFFGDDIDDDIMSIQMVQP